MCFFPLRDLSVGSLEVRDLAELRIGLWHCIVLGDDLRTIWRSFTKLN